MNTLAFYRQRQGLTQLCQKHVGQPRALMSATVKTEKKPTNASSLTWDWGGKKILKKNFLKKKINNNNNISLEMSGFGSW